MINEDNLDNSIVIFNKNGFIIKRNERNSYTISFEIENEKIFFKNLMNFTTLDILCSLNKDIIDSYKLKINETNNSGILSGNIFILYKHLFQDLGFPQHHSFLNMVINKNIDESLVVFNIKSIHNYEDISKYTDNIDIIQQTKNIKIKNIVSYNKINTPNSINCECCIYLENGTYFTEFIEKIGCQLLYKIFIRTKSFIEMSYK